MYCCEFALITIEEKVAGVTLLTNLTFFNSGQ